MAIGTIVRMNLDALMTAAGEGRVKGPKTVLELEALSGVGKTTIYRILDHDADYLLTLTTLIKLAAAYEIPVWQFLYPQLYADPASPPHVLTPQEQIEHEEWHAVYLQVQAIANGRTVPPGASGASNGNTHSGENPGTQPTLPKRRPKASRP